MKKDHLFFFDESRIEIIYEIFDLGVIKQHVGQHCFGTYCSRNKYSCLVQLYLEKGFFNETFKTGSRVYLKFKATISKAKIHYDPFLISP